VVTTVLQAETALAVDLTSSGGFLFDIEDTATGALTNGSIDAYDTCYSLLVNEGGYDVAGAPSEVDGRLVRMAKTRIGNVNVSRTILVPNEAGRDYARYIDTFENLNEGPISIQVRYTGNLGSDGSTTVWATSSGDTSVAPNDQWFGTDDVDGDGDPSLGHLFAGVGGRVAPEMVALASDNIDVRFTVEIAGRQAASIMFFAFQGPNQETVRRQIEEVIVDPGGAMTDLSPEEVERIANWPTIGGFPVLTDFDVVADQTEPEPIYSATLTVRVETAEGPMQQAVAIAEELGGRVEQRGDTRAVLRVPVEQFSVAVARLEALGYVLSRNVRIQRGSNRVRDLRVRLQSAQDVRTRLLQLARRSPSTAEAVAIERQIERLNLLIEQLESYLRELEERVRFSTIELLFEEERVVEPIPRELWGLPFSWLDELGLDNLLDVH